VLSARPDRRAGAARPEQGCRTAGLMPREDRVAPPDLPGPLHAGRPGVASRPVPAAAASPLGRGLRGHSRHYPGLAPQADLAQVGLFGASPARASPNRISDQEPGDPHGHREPDLGTPARTRRTGPAWPSHRRLHRVADPPATPISTQHHAGQARPGASFLPPKPRPSWPWTSCTWIPCCSSGSTR
jgi:hypothetical protein